MIYFYKSLLEGRVVKQGLIAGTAEEIHFVNQTFLENGKALLPFLRLYLDKEVIYELLQVAFVARAWLVVFKPDVIWVVLAD